MKSSSILVFLLLLWTQLSQANPAQLCPNISFLNRNLEIIDSPLFQKVSETRFEYNLERGIHDYYASAELTLSSVVNLDIKLKDENGRAEIRGRDFIRKVLIDIFPNADYLRGFWSGGVEKSDNFHSFHAALSKGLSFEKAAFQTHTGKIARSLGYTHVIKSEVLKSSDPAMSLVHVLFVKDSRKKEVALLDVLQTGMSKESPEVRIKLHRNKHLGIFKQLDVYLKDDTIHPFQAFLWTSIGNIMKAKARSSDYKLSQLLESKVDSNEYILVFRKQE